MKNNFIRRKIAESMDMQGDFLTDCVMIRLCGNHELILENYKGILEYNDKRIYIKTKPNNVSITGSSLEIRTITDEFLYITGKVKGVSFVDEGEV